KKNLRQFRRPRGQSLRCSAWGPYSSFNLRSTLLGLAHSGHRASLVVWNTTYFAPPRVVIWILRKRRLTASFLSQSYAACSDVNVSIAMNSPSVVWLPDLRDAAIARHVPSRVKSITPKKSAPASGERGSIVSIELPRRI